MNKQPFSEDQNAQHLRPSNPFDSKKNVIQQPMIQTRTQNYSTQDATFNSEETKNPMNSRPEIRGKDTVSQKPNKPRVFSKWDSDEDDTNEKKLLEYLEAKLTTKSTEGQKEAYVDENQNQKILSLLSKENEKQNENAPGVIELPDDELRESVLTPGDKRTKLGDTLITEYVENPQSNTDSDRYSPKKDSSSNENNSSLEKFEGQQQQKLKTNEISTGIPEISSQKEKPVQKEEAKQSDLFALRQKKEKELLKPVYFNIIVVGGSGLGKSTFIDAFLKKKLKGDEVIRASTLEIQEITGERVYKDMSFKMKLVDTPGYGSRKDILEWYKMIKSEIKKQFSDYRLKTKQDKKRKKFQSFDCIEDTRIHACLYFLAGPRISHLDILYMKKIQKYTTIIPVLAKGDSYTVAEAKQLKLELLQQAHDSKIEFFDFNQALKDQPRKKKELNQGRFGPSPPFLIISSVDKIYINDDEYIYGRVYSWGVCDMENPEHSDFLILSSLLGGYICFECISVTDALYVEHFKRLKRKTKKEPINKEPTFVSAQKIGIGALAMGVFGAYMLLKHKIGIKE